MNYYVYIIENDFNEMKYIGISDDYTKRFNQHKRANTTLGRAIQHHGEQHFRIKVLKSSLSVEQARIEEVRLIEEYNTLYPIGYNVGKGGEGGKDNTESKPSARQYLNVNVYNFNKSFKLDFHAFFDDTLKYHEYKEIELSSHEDVEIEMNLNFDLDMYQYHLYYDSKSEILFWKKYDNSGLLFNEVKSHTFYYIKFYSHPMIYDKNFNRLYYSNREKFLSYDTDYSNQYKFVKNDCIKYPYHIKDKSLYIKKNGSWELLFIYPSEDYNINDELINKKLDEYKQKEIEQQEENNRLEQEKQRILQLKLEAKEKQRKEEIIKNIQDKYTWGFISLVFGVLLIYPLFFIEDGVGILALPGGFLILLGLSFFFKANKQKTDLKK